MEGDHDEASTDPQHPPDLFEKCSQPLELAVHFKPDRLEHPRGRMNPRPGTHADRIHDGLSQLGGRADWSTPNDPARDPP